MSSTVLTVLSRYSRKNTSPTPATRLIRNPISMVRGLLGATGDIGTCGGSIIFVLLRRLVLCNRQSVGERCFVSHCAFIVRFQLLLKRRFAFIDLSLNRGHLLF